MADHETTKAPPDYFVIVDHAGQCLHLVRRDPASVDTVTIEELRDVIAALDGRTVDPETLLDLGFDLANTAEGFRDIIREAYRILTEGDAHSGMIALSSDQPITIAVGRMVR